MPTDIEVNLRIPSVKDPVKDANGYPVRSADVRFIRAASVPALPKPGALLRFDLKNGASIECEVHRAEWSESKERFVVFCRYSKRSIPPDEYHALTSDPDWEMRPLL